jgi:hypothetical protein
VTRRRSSRPTVRPSRRRKPAPLQGQSPAAAAESRRDAHDWASLILNIIVAVATVAAVFAALWIASSSDKDMARALQALEALVTTNANQQKAVTALAEATSRFAQSSQRQVEIAQAAMVNDRSAQVFEQSPHLAVSITNVANYGPGREAVGVFTVVNSGRAPALNVQVSAGSDFALAGADQRAIWSKLPKDRIANVYNYKPELWPVGASLPLRDYMLLASGGAELIFIGRVRYRDRAGKVHSLHFCRSISGPAEAPTETVDCWKPQDT